MLTLAGSICPVSEGAGTIVKRSSWPDFKSLAEKIGASVSMISAAWLGSVPILVNRLIKLSPRPTVSVLISAPANRSSKSSSSSAVSSADLRITVVCGESAKPVFGMIGRLHEARLTVAGRRALGIGEDLGSLGHQPADVFWLELDPV